MPDENITVLVLNSVKRVKSFKVNRFRIRIAIITGVCFIAVLSISLGANFYLYQQNRNIAGQLAAVDSQPGSDRMETAASELNGSEDRDHTLAAARNLRSDTVKASRATADAAVTPGAAEDIYAGDIDSDMVGIDNLTSSRELNMIELNISFNLINKLESNQVISGYVVIVAKTSDNNMTYVSWPHMETDARGMPIDHLRGDRFSIKYLKNVEARMLLDDPAERYLFYRIIIYDLNGRMLMLRTIEI